MSNEIAIAPAVIIAIEPTHNILCDGCAQSPVTFDNRGSYRIWLSHGNNGHRNYASTCDNPDHFAQAVAYARERATLYTLHSLCRWFRSQNTATKPIKDGYRIS